MEIKKNDIIEIEITGMTAEGSGIGRYNGLAVFTAASAIGDRLSVRIIKVSKKYVIGKIEKILIPSPDRQIPDCKSFPKCGGCCYRHISYEAELCYKKQRVTDALERIGGFRGIAVNDIIGAENPDGYRNKAQIPVGKDRDGSVIMGFYAQNSHRIIPYDDCRLQPQIFNSVTKIIKAWIDRYKPPIYDEITGNGLLRHIYIRYGEKTGELMVCLVINGKKINNEDELCRMLRENLTDIKSIVLNTNTQDTNVILGKSCMTLYGSDFITDVLCGLRFNISPLSFYQVNRTQAERLYTVAKHYANLSKDEILFDIYCGTGTIGLSMADECKAVYGIEIIPEAIENAKQNAMNNSVKNAQFICADAYTGAKELIANGIKPDVIVLDPPRKGCSSDLIDLAVSLLPKRIVYVSCDPATLARDLKIFDDKGYEIGAVQPVDMFPRTGHVETVVLMIKK